MLENTIPALAQLRTMRAEARQKGFSLLELLVVIVIIILLGTISVIALNDQRAKARDSQRISDVRQITTALEFYRSDEGTYPAVQAPIVLGVGNAVKLCSKSVGSFVSVATPCNPEAVYMPNIPKDPLASQNYSYAGTGAAYQIIFQTEKSSEIGLAGKYQATVDGISAIK
jgi:general secretion pathway protein G